MNILEKMEEGDKGAEPKDERKMENEKEIEDKGKDNYVLIIDENDNDEIDNDQDKTTAAEGDTDKKGDSKIEEKQVTGKKTKKANKNKDTKNSKRNRTEGEKSDSDGQREPKVKIVPKEDEEEKKEQIPLLEEPNIDFTAETITTLNNTENTPDNAETTNTSHNATPQNWADQEAIQETTEEIEMQEVEEEERPVEEMSELEKKKKAWMDNLHWLHKTHAEVKPTAMARKENPKTYAGATKGNGQNQEEKNDVWVNKGSVLGNMRCFSREEAYSIKVVEVMETIKTQHPAIYPQLKGITLLNSTEMEITFTEEKSANVIAMSGFDIRGKHVQCKKETEGRTMVTIYNLPTSLPEEYIKKYLSQYGDDISGFQQFTTDETGRKILTGQRFYWLNMNPDKCLGRLIEIQGRKAKTKYTGMEERIHKYEQLYIAQKKRETEEALRKAVEEDKRKEKEEEERKETYRRQCQMPKVDGTIQCAQIHPEAPDMSMNPTYATDHRLKHGIVKERQAISESTFVKRVLDGEEPHRMRKDGVVYDCVKLEGMMRHALVTNGLLEILPWERQEGAKELLLAGTLYTLYGELKNYDRTKIDRELYSDQVIEHWELISENGREGYTQVDTFMDSLFWDIYLCLPVIPTDETDEQGPETQTTETT